MSRGPWKKKKIVTGFGPLPDETIIEKWQEAITAKCSAPQRGGFYWLVMRNSEAEGFNEETAAQRAIQELRSQFTTDAEFAACSLFPEILAYYGNDWKRTREALKKAGI
jgi:hypothetical protein